MVAASVEPKPTPEEDFKARRSEAIKAKALEIEKVVRFAPRNDLTSVISLEPVVYAITHLVSVVFVRYEPLIYDKKLNFNQTSAITAFQNLIFFIRKKSLTGFHCKPLTLSDIVLIKEQSGI